MALTRDCNPPSTNVRNVLCAEAQTSFTEFLGQKNINRLKLRQTCHSLMWICSVRKGESRPVVAAPYRL